MEWMVVWDRKMGIQINIFVNGQVPIEGGGGSRVTLILTLKVGLWGPEEHGRSKV